MFLSSNRRGFTLLELLVTMAIISILTAIAVPRYQDFKERGFDIRASSDLRAIAIAEEAYYIDNESYLSCQDNTCTNLPGIVAISKGVSVSITATESAFNGTASHDKGTGKIFTWDSELGGLQ